MGENDWRPVRFIGAPVEVHFDNPPTLLKKPGPPDAFHWQGETFRVRRMISAWHTYERRGRFARNMRASSLRKAVRRGSWGVGRFYFRLETEGGRIFDLYYDRAPKEAGDREGSWILWREMARGA